MDIKEPVRIGRIDYTNVWPIYYHFPLDQFAGELELIKQVPTQLNRAMAEGRIDMGPISSFAYGENFGEYVLYPDLSVSAYGKVNSILLFHRKPFAEIVNGRIALTTASASSVNLLKILIAKFFGGRPAYISAEPCLHDMMENNDAALLIGDDAIRASWAENGYEVTDLGELWQRMTGCWMTFAVWAVRKETVRSQGELVRRIFEGFMDSKRKGLADDEPLVRAATASVGGTDNYWRAYFGQLSHDFGPLQWTGLQQYYDYAYELGLLPKPVPLQIWDDTPFAKVTG